MNQPGPMGQEQQRQIIGRIGQALAATAPGGWQQLVVDYRAAGRHIEADVIVTGSDGIPRAGQPAPEVMAQLAGLRSGMYQPGRGTWFGVTLVFTPVQAPRVEFAFDQEPRWRQVPPPIGFQDELRFFPRAADVVPDWLARRLAQAPPGAPEAVVPEAVVPQGEAPSVAAEQGLRTPRVYDGLDDAGRPVADREPLPAEERDAVLRYLDAAPVVLAARSYDADAFDPDRAPSVPMNFRTDGAWVWPGAVGYYLREHALAPDPELLAHIRRHRYTPPDVDEPTRDRAIAAITDQPT